MHKFIMMALAICLGVSAAYAQNNDVRYKRPTCPGTFYPAQIDQLKAAAQQYITDAVAAESPGRLVAVIAPQAMYPYSGGVAAHAFKNLKPGQYDRVIILTPSNFASFRGCSIPAVEYLVTPISPIPVDLRAIDDLCWSPLIDRRAVEYVNPNMGKTAKRHQLHEREYGDEVNLPFLQVQLQKFSVISIVVGDFIDYFGKTDMQALDAVAKAIRDQVDGRTLLVVSTDFTRYGNKFSYRPFKDDVLNRVEELDREAFDLILNKDAEAFNAYLKRTKNPINGANALMLMMKVLDKNAQGQLLSYDTSGRIKGDTSSSVSYAAFAFYDSTLLPAEPRPIAEAPEAEPETKPASNTATP